jgi:hypothetical protein
LCLAHRAGPRFPAATPALPHWCGHAAIRLRQDQIRSGHCGHFDAQIDAIHQRARDARLVTGAAVNFVSSKLRELESRQRDLKERLRTKQHDLELLNNRISTFYESKNEVRSFVERLQSPSGDELFKLRAQIASRIKNLVETLVVAPLGDRPKTQKAIDFLMGQGGADDLISHLTERLASKTDDRRYFAIGFRNGTVRAVFPTEEDPLRYGQQLVVTGGSATMLTPGNSGFAVWPEELT